MLNEVVTITIKNAITCNFFYVFVAVGNNWNDAQVGLQTALSLAPFKSVPESSYADDYNQVSLSSNDFNLFCIMIHTNCLF